MWACLAASGTNSLHFQEKQCPRPDRPEITKMYLDGPYTNSLPERASFETFWGSGGVGPVRGLISMKNQGFLKTGLSGVVWRCLARLWRSGAVWDRLKPSGTVWAYPALSGTSGPVWGGFGWLGVVWRCLRLVWACSGPCGAVWVGPCGTVWRSLGPSGPVWHLLWPSGPVWYGFELFGVVWRCLACLKQSGAVWIRLELFGSV